MLITEDHPKWPFYRQLNKCGEITASTDGRHFGLNCSHCSAIFPWINIKDFLRHLHYQHKRALNPNGDQQQQQQQEQEQKQKQQHQSQQERKPAKRRRKCKSPSPESSSAKLEEDDLESHSSVSYNQVENTEITSPCDSAHPTEYYRFEDADFDSVPKSEEPSDSEDVKVEVDKAVKVSNKDESDWHFSSDEEDPVTHLDLDSFESREVLSYIIEVYQENPMLWDKEDTCYTIFPKKAKLFREMENEIKSRFNIRVGYASIRSAFERLRKLYSRELLNSVKKNSKRKPPKLWCFKMLEFLRDQELAENSTIEITFDQLTQMAEIYEHYPLLWRYDNDDCHDRVKQVETQREMLLEVNDKLQLNMTLNQFRVRIARLRKFYSTDKRKRLNCEECNEEFEPDQPIFYEKLQFLETFIGPFRCKLCCLELPKYSQFSAHLAAHDGRLPYTCPVCQKDFKYLNNFVVHKRRHVGEKPFVCTYCGAGFAAATDLKLHETMHTGEKSHICHICGMAFRTLGLLRVHRVRHDPNRPRFECTQCTRVFVNKNSLKEHIIGTHTQERTFVCPVCDKAFFSRKTMRQHMQLHDKEKKHQCQFCESKFSQRAGLCSHMNRYHADVDMD